MDDAESFLSKFAAVEMKKIDTVVESPKKENKHTTYVTKETQYRYLIYDIIKSEVNEIFGSYSKEKPEFLTRSELVGFLKDFLRS